MENVKLVIEKGKVSKLHIVYLDNFFKEDCLANNHIDYEEPFAWFDIHGNKIGYQSLEKSKLLIENKNIKDGTYISFSSNISDDNDYRMFGCWVKKGGIVREIDEVELYLGITDKENFIKTNKYGFKYYETGFPVDLNFNRIGDDTEDIKPIITLPFFMEVMDNNEEHPHLFDEINELINQEICSKATEDLEFGKDQYEALLLLNHNEDVFDILRKYSLV